MENLRYSLFDLFVYALPGSILFISIFLANLEPELISGLDSILELFKDKFSIYFIGISLLFSYVLGFISSLFSSSLLELKELALPPKKGERSGMGNSQRYVLLRELSKENFKYLELWNVYKNMALNLALNMLGALIILAFSFQFHWGYFLLVVLVAVLLVFKASKFKEWYEYDSDNAVALLEKINPSYKK